jgi:patatin-related protein
VREKELRLALVCYGGVSLAVYMHGTTKEVWKLVRASMRRSAPADAGLPPAGDSEIVYGALLDALAPKLDLRVMVDIIAGASAGGINGIFLAQAISQGHDMEPLRDLWLDGADSDKLLEPEGAAERFSKWWASPLVWWARGKGLVMDDMKEPEARAEVSRKLSRLMRSRWFKPPFSGEIFSTMLYDALTAMAAGDRTPPLLPPVQPLDLFVTVTDYHGAPERLHLHSPAEVIETEHRLVIDFNDPGADAANGPGCERHLADIAELAFAARATASFPGAFPPARVAEIDTVLRARGGRWPGRAAFLARVFPGRNDPELATLIDGSVLNNRPFGPAIEALARRPAHREVDRRFVYVDPKPGMNAEAQRETLLPGFFATVLRSLADIPRHQPIADNLAAIDTLSARIRQLRYVVEGMTPEVDTAIAGALGLRVFLLKLTGERLAEWRSKAQSLAARNAGFAYVAYGQLKVAQIVENLAQRLARLGDVAPEAVRAALWREIRERGFDRPAQAQSQTGAVSDYVTFLRNFDLEFRIRRLRFLIRRVNALTEAASDTGTRAALDTMKAGLYQIIAPHLQRRQPGFFDAAVRESAARSAMAPGAAMAALASALDLKGLDAESDAALVRLFGTGLPRGLRRTLISAYLGFPFFDIALLPLLQGETSDEFDEIKVDRLSPDDSLSLRAAGGGRLKGAQFNAFGAFFSRAYREHDYLWGRLHGAERLIDIVASALPEAAMLPTAELTRLKHRAFVAIVEDERAQLQQVPELFEALDRVLADGSARG